MRRPSAQVYTLISAPHRTEHSLCSASAAPAHLEAHSPSITSIWRHDPDQITSIRRPIPLAAVHQAIAAGRPPSPTMQVTLRAARLPPEHYSIANPCGALRARQTRERVIFKTQTSML